jgi:hypothetical protein
MAGLAAAVLGLFQTVQAVSEARAGAVRLESPYRSVGTNPGARGSAATLEARVYAAELKD